MSAGDPADAFLFARWLDETGQEPRRLSKGRRPTAYAQWLNDAGISLYESEHDTSSNAVKLTGAIIENNRFRPMEARNWRSQRRRWRYVG